MKSIDKVLEKALPKGKVPPATSGQSAGRDHVDSINQVFAELELAYHNQFHKAFAAEGSLNLTKKYWLQSLSAYTPEVLRRAVRHIVRSQEFLPTLAAMIAACENAPALFGLPSAEIAYREACLAPEPKSTHPWSHPAVYYAAQATGWFVLASEPQSVALPQFDYHYTVLCRRVLQGESLAAPLPLALPSATFVPLDTDSSRARLKALRTRFEL